MTHTDAYTHRIGDEVGFRSIPYHSGRGTIESITFRNVPGNGAIGGTSDQEVVDVVIRVIEGSTTSRLFSATNQKPMREGSTHTMCLYPFQLTKAVFEETYGV